jgi:hypothetical protein
MSSRHQHRPELRPRVVNDAQLARYLGKSISWLAEHRHQLEAQGFPRRLAAIGGNDLDAVDRWLDRLHTTISTAPSSALAEELWRKATANVDA